MSRVYLDWNATAPLRPEARAAMIAAMDAIGNPSSVHAEGRAAHGIIAKARDQVAQAFGCDRNGIIFTSGATEAAAMMLRGRDFAAADIEHDCVHVWPHDVLDTEPTGRVVAGEGAVVQGANSETGVLQSPDHPLLMSDQVQVFGKCPVAFNWLGARSAILSAHKIGGPKGVGALVLAEGVDVPALIQGGGQEEGRRSGTENLIGIAGFGAAAEAAMRDLDAGLWTAVEEMRDTMENAIAQIAPDAICVGKGQKRLPNTACIAVPGWKGETQVMQMDLAGYAISAGSACSSGKVKQSRVLRAMGFDDVTAGSAIRISLGPTTDQDEINGFVAAWGAAYERYAARAA